VKPLLLGLGRGCILLGVDTDGLGKHSRETVAPPGTSALVLVLAVVAPFGQVFGISSAAQLAQKD